MFSFPAALRERGDEIWWPSRYPPLVHLRAGPSAFDLPGVTRDLWERAPIEMNVSADASADDGRVRATIELAPAPPGHAGSPITVAVDAYATEGLAHYGFWSFHLPTLDAPTTVVLEIDLRSKEFVLRANGRPLSERSLDASTNAWAGEAQSGRFLASLAVWRSESPGDRRVFPLFEFTRDEDVAVVQRVTPLEPTRLELRVKNAR